MAGVKCLPRRQAKPTLIGKTASSKARVSIRFPSKDQGR